VLRLATIACLLTPLAAAPAADAQRQQRPPLGARLVACTTGATAPARVAVFSARMPALPGTRRMWMRFDLLQRTPGQAEYERVRLPAWGVWERSQPGRTGFIYTKRVQGLRAPGAYRARVRFRWSDATGRVQQRATRTTPTCRQPDPRPDLTAGALSAMAGLGSGATYLLEVGNDGRGPAPPFDVVLSVAGMPEPAVRVAGLAPDEHRVVSIAGPRCAPGWTVRFVLDAAGAVDEADEAGDVVDRPCPAIG
jgi:CARDB protein